MNCCNYIYESYKYSLLNQQLIAPQFSKPEEVVSHFGAMQAQEYRMMRWAMEMRTRRPSEKAFTKAFNEGKIVRIHLLRGTWQLVSAEDYWWMLDLCATKAKQVINGWTIIVYLITFVLQNLTELFAAVIFFP